MSQNTKQVSINNINYKLYETIAKVIESKNATGDITIPKYIEFGGEKFSVYKIGKRGFYNSSITSITFPEDSEVESFGKQVFGICKSIKSIKFPPKLSKIGRGWCVETPSLDKIELMEGNQNYITENNAIYTSDKSTLIFCQRNVESFEIPLTVSTIDIFAFRIHNLKTIIFAENSNLMQINCSAFRGSAIESIDLPASLQIIKDYAFCGCHNLKTVTFQEGSQLKTILHHAFDDTGLSSIALSGPISMIGMGCFKGSKNLNKLTFTNETSVKIHKNAFLDVSPEFKLYIRKNSFVNGEGKPDKIEFLQEPNDDILLKINYLQEVIDWMIKQPQFTD